PRGMREVCAPGDGAWLPDALSNNDVTKVVCHERSVAHPAADLQPPWRYRVCVSSMPSHPSHSPRVSRTALAAA
ncbi:MAG TPA: hypothetical protein VFA63_12460, partial [Pseudonocardiaceae bacterium]|nr:hypothetical protein [Pseudonocardiaceae bacterium]